MLNNTTSGEEASSDEDESPSKAPSGPSVSASIMSSNTPLADGGPIADHWVLDLPAPYLLPPNNSRSLKWEQPIHVHTYMRK